MLSAIGFTTLRLLSGFVLRLGSDVLGANLTLYCFMDFKEVVMVGLVLVMILASFDGFMTSGVHQSIRVTAFHQVEK